MPKFNHVNSLSSAQHRLASFDQVTCFTCNLSRTGVNLCEQGSVGSDHDIFTSFEYRDASYFVEFIQRFLRGGLVFSGCMHFNFIFTFGNTNLSDLPKAALVSSRVKCIVLIFSFSWKVSLTRCSRVVFCPRSERRKIEQWMRTLRASRVLSKSGRVCLSVDSLFLSCVTFSRTASLVIIRLNLFACTRLGQTNRGSPPLQSGGNATLLRRTPQSCLHAGSILSYLAHILRGTAYWALTLAAGCRSARLSIPRAGMLSRTGWRTTTSQRTLFSL